MALALARRFLFLAILMQTNDPRWVHSTIDDPLHNATIETFILPGTYTTPPVRTDEESPRFVIRCDKDKKRKPQFRDSYIITGAVLNQSVELRWDDSKSTKKVSWISSSDFQGLFIVDPVDSKKQAMLQVLTGRFGIGDLTRAENQIAKGNIAAPGLLIHSLYIGVMEFAGSQVVLHFDMPQDIGELASVCGLIKS